MPVLGPRDLAGITDDDISEYQRLRLSAGRKARTVNSETATLLQVLNWAKRKGLMQRLPEVEAIPYRAPLLDLPSQEEMARILDALPERERALVRFFAETGCRKGEVFHLTWDDVDLQAALVAIRQKEGFTPKTAHSERRIPIGPGLVESLSALPREGQLVFPGRGGVVRTSVGKALATAIRTARITRGGKPMKLTLHMLRKAHATWQKERGIEETVLQSRLGHARGSRVTNAVYVHMSTEAQRNAILNLPAAGSGQLATVGNALSGGRSQFRAKSLETMVGATGIEPVTPTMST
ncbi:site-specific integrase [Salinarimonas rosea]|uniref:tyrosine-type recombinase/integrase n=1 Tax=Salinarimonas rosea TaxID=552063 RepID=UPI0009FE7338